MDSRTSSSPPPPTSPCWTLLPGYLPLDNPMLGEAPRIIKHFWFGGDVRGGRCPGARCPEDLSGGTCLGEDVLKPKWHMVHWDVVRTQPCQIFLTGHCSSLIMVISPIKLQTWGKSVACVPWRLTCYTNTDIPNFWMLQTSTYGSMWPKHSL